MKDKNNGNRVTHQIASDNDNDSNNNNNNTNHNHDNAKQLVVLLFITLIWTALREYFNPLLTIQLRK